MTYNISKDSRAEVNSWLDVIEEGDNLRVCNGDLVFTNTLGCEINRIPVEGYSDGIYTAPQSFPLKDNLVQYIKEMVLTHGKESEIDKDFKLMRFYDFTVKFGVRLSQDYAEVVYRHNPTGKFYYRSCRTQATMIEDLDLSVLAEIVSAIAKIQ